MWGEHGGGNPTIMRQAKKRSLQNQIFSANTNMAPGAVIENEVARMSDDEVMLRRIDISFGIGSIATGTASIMDLMCACAKMPKFEVPSNSRYSDESYCVRNIRCMSVARLGTSDSPQVHNHDEIRTYGVRIPYDQKLVFRFENLSSEIMDIIYFLRFWWSILGA